MISHFISDFLANRKRAVGKDMADSVTKKMRKLEGDSTGLFHFNGSSKFGLIGFRI